LPNQGVIMSRDDLYVVADFVLRNTYQPHMILDLEENFPNYSLRIYSKQQEVIS